MEFFQRYPLIFLGIAAIFIFYIFLLRKKSANKFKYQPIPYINSKSEQNFFAQLIKIVPTEQYLLCKVRLADICKPVDPKNIVAFNKISRKHLDFVVVNKVTSKIICAIELDDKSHFSKSSMKRDLEKNRALDSSKIKLFRVKTTRSYNLYGIEKYLNSYVVKKNK